MNDWPVIGICDKCSTENSLLFQYGNKWLCKANECYQEEVERDSGRHIDLDRKLEEHRKIIARSNG